MALRYFFTLARLFQYGLVNSNKPVEGFGLIGEADLFIPNFSQFITMAGDEQWQDMQISDTFEGTAFDKPVRLTRRS